MALEPKKMPPASSEPKSNLPSVWPSVDHSPLAMLEKWLKNLPPPTANQQLPNASLVYGVAAAILFAIAVYFLFRGLWFTGLIMLLPGAAFLGFALYYLRYPDVE